MSASALGRGRGRSGPATPAAGRVSRHARAVASRAGLTEPELHTLAALRTPERIQEFVVALPTNFERDGGTCLSVRRALRERRAHCIEGAFVAAMALWLAGERPLLMDFQSARGDDDHVVALFRRGACWGAVSKSNHVWLRWRDPVYRSLRELAMSYFHEYVRGDAKTLRTYSRPFDLSKIDPASWVTNEEQCWDVAAAVDSVRHWRLITPAQARALRKRDAFELEAGRLLEYPAPDRRSGERY